MKTSTKLFSTVALGALMALPVPAPADAALNEIVVTARKREETLQDVPISVSAFTAEAIAEKGIISIDDVARFTPGMSFETAFGRGTDQDRPIIRGMSNIFGSGASIFIDGVYLSTTVRAADLSNIERIEVIRGPQSALYGRATFSGAINFITRKPGNEFEGTASATYATWNQKEFSGRISGPIVQDNLFFSLNARFYRFGGDYANRHATGGQLNKEESFNLGGRLRWTPAPTFEADLKFEYAEDDDGPFAIGTQLSDKNNCFLATQRQYFCGELEVPWDKIGFNKEGLPDWNGGGIERWTYRSVLDVDWEIADGWHIQSKTSYDDVLEHSGIDGSFTMEDFIVGVEASLPAPGARKGFILRPPFFTKQAFGWFDFSAGESKIFSQDLRLVSPEDARFRWSIGGYYLNDVGKSRTLSAVLATPGTVNTKSKTENIAVYGYMEYDVTEQLEVGFEGRWARDKLTTLNVPTALFRSAKFSAFTPRMTANYTVNDDIMVYGVVARGNKPGGFNSASLAILDPSLGTFDEEKVWSYEVGAKTTWWDKKLGANIAFYYIDWNKQQLTQARIIPDPLDVDGDGVTVEATSPTVNAGQTEVYGAELEMSFVPNDNWDFQFTYAYNRAKFTKYDDEQQEILTGDPSAVGNRPPRSPRQMISFSAGYSQPLFGDWDGFLRGDVTYETSKYVQIHNFARYGEGARVNFRTGVRNGRYKLEIWGKNIFNYDKPAAATRFIDLVNDGLFSIVDRAGAGLPEFHTTRAFSITPPRKPQWGVTGTMNF